MGNIFRTERKQDRKDRVVVKSEPRLDEWRLKSKKRQFGNNPVSAVPCNCLIGCSMVMTSGEEGGNKLDRTALIFHFDEGKSSQQ